MIDADQVQASKDKALFRLGGGKDAKTASQIE